MGVVSQTSLSRKVAELNLSLYSSCMPCLTRDFVEVSIETPLYVVHKILEREIAVFATERNEKGAIKVVYMLDRDTILNILNEKIKELL